MMTAGRKYRTMVGLFVVVLMVLSTLAWGQEAERIGTVLVVEGVAEVRAEGTQEWERLRFRDAIFRHDTVRTGAESKVKILMRDDSILTLAAQSEMAFTEFVFTRQRRRSIVNLLIGTLKVVTTRFFGAGSQLEVHTPNTVAGVRGTTFIVRFIPPDTTEIFVLEGVVTARNLNPAIPEVEPIPPNTRTSVVGATAPAKPVVIAPEVLQPLEQELQVVEQVPAEVTPTEELPPLEPARGAPEGVAPPTGKEGRSDSAVVSVPVPAAVPEVAPAVEPQIEAASRVGEGPQTTVVTPDTSPQAQEAIQESLVHLVIKIPRRQDAHVQLTIQIPR
jgi:hypothetical protein